VLVAFWQWDNHRRSLSLESEMWQKLNSQIDKKVEKGDGTWIDWQYLKDASSLLLKVDIQSLILWVLKSKVY
jgi:hypothetical protein